MPWTPGSDEKGGGGGAGGGLGALFASVIRIGTTGQILVDGGGGASGENTSFLDSVGGNGGGGSGGFLLLQAQLIDLSQAGSNALRAVGGPGGRVGPAPWGYGGNGGPGIIQLHTPHQAGVLLPRGVSLDQLSAPDAHSLLPVFDRRAGR